MLPIAILCGGFATRLGVLSRDVPKNLIEIGGKPFVDWQLELLIENGFKEFVFCVSHKSELLREHLGSGSKWGVKFKFSDDGDTQLGTGGALKKATRLLGEKFAVTYGDSYLPIDLVEVENMFLKSKALGVMTLFKNKDKFDSSNLKYQGGKLIDYDKNSKKDGFEYIDYGFTYLNVNVFEDYSERSNFGLEDVYKNLILREKLEAFEVFNRFYEIGSVGGINEFSNYLRRENNELQ
jgi:MurNAc alpha-1-phosphate uridylyltransferase